MVWMDWVSILCGYMEFDGVGWGGTGYQKCPLIFFILCKYIDKVYTYIYI